MSRKTKHTYVIFLPNALVQNVPATNVFVNTSKNNSIMPMECSLIIDSIMDRSSRNTKLPLSYNHITIIWHSQLLRYNLIPLAETTTNGYPKKNNELLRNQCMNPPICLLGKLLTMYESLL